MGYPIERHHRHSSRMRGYDYSQPGSYFLTLCAHNRDCRFGEVVDGSVQLSPMGRVASDCWSRIPRHFLNVVLDEFVVMPNHLHGIITIVHDVVRTDPNGNLIRGRGLMNTHARRIRRANTNRVFPSFRVEDSPQLAAGSFNQTPTTAPDDTHFNGEWILMRNPKQVLGKIVRHYKARTSKLVRDGGYPYFQWQRNYYEHIIRNEIDLNKIRQYIVDNPRKWDEDEENPARR